MLWFPIGQFTFVKKNNLILFGRATMFEANSAVRVKLSKSVSSNNVAKTNALIPIAEIFFKF